MNNMPTKVFCIGFHKTGTTSLAIALEELGYKVTGPNSTNDPNISENVYQMADELVQQYDAFQDNPWPIIYQELDQKYPGSKFILTIRSTESWIESQLKHFGTQETQMRKWIYGVGAPKGNEEVYIKRFERHNQEVLAYFKDRPQDLLFLDFTKGDGWNKLCNFLDKEIPQIPFPHANQAKTREQANRWEHKLMRGIKKIVSPLAMH